MEHQPTLPHITLSMADIEQRIKQKMRERKEYENRRDSPRDGHSHNIKVTSPFYQRINQQLPPEKCCANLPTKQLKCLHSRYIDDDASASSWEQMSSSKYVTPQKKTKIEKFVLNTKTAVGFTGFSLPRIHPRQQKQEEERIKKNIGSMKSHQSQYKKRLIQSVSHYQSKIGNQNNQFINLLQQRLSNDKKFKQKYLRNLFKFIRVKKLKDKAYQSDSCGYLETNLPLLLNHFKIEQLICTDLLTDYEKQQLAYYMNCNQGKAVKIVEEMADVFKEFEDHIQQLKQKQKIKEEKEGQGKDEAQQSLKTEKILDGMFTPNEKNSPHSKNTLNRLASTFNNLSSLDIQNGIRKGSVRNTVTSIPNLDNLESKDKFMNSRKAFQNLDQNQEVKGQKKYKARNSKIIHNLNGLDFQQAKNEFGNAVQSKKGNRKGRKGLINKSRIDQIEEVEGEEPTKNVSRRNSNASVSSSKRASMNSSDWQRKLKNQNHSKFKKPLLCYKEESERLAKLQKYSHIDYQDYCTQNEFENLVSEVERVDKNDQQKSMAMFKYLKIENHLLIESNLKDVVERFESMFTNAMKEYFMKHLIYLKDKKYIEMLERELDDKIRDVRNNDPRKFCCEIFEEKRAYPFQTESRIVGFKSQKESKYSRLSFLEEPKEILKRKENQKKMLQESQDEQPEEQEKQLTQKELLEFVQHQISPELSEVFKPIPTTTKLKAIGISNLAASDEAVIDRSTIDCQKHKKILNYMKKNHNSIFKDLANNYNILSKQLEQ